MKTCRHGGEAFIPHAGRGAGIRLGQHLVQPKDTPLCNVWLTLLKGSGVDAERFGDSTGVITELQVG